MDGFELHYLDRGSGEVVLLVSGPGGSAASFGGLVPLLASDHRTVAVDPARPSREDARATSPPTIRRQE